MPGLLYTAVSVICKRPPIYVSFHCVRMQELVLWKISEAVRSGDLDLDLSDRGLDTLPEEIFDLPWLQVLELSKNRFVNCE